ncbi:MAG: gliding motility-associated C-terminal domain-containing protein [Chitinophagaceae bacterium]|nr:gliding motility-associated C-terminal domain-containing protein [Chitinophagaceae bacterium]
MYSGWRWKNDYFKATFYGNLIRFNLQVFNRYGHIVFQSTDPQKSWNGSYRGARSGTEVFTWRVFTSWRVNY